MLSSKVRLFFSVWLLGLFRPKKSKKIFLFLSKFPPQKWHSAPLNGSKLIHYQIHWNILRHIYIYSHLCNTSTVKRVWQLVWVCTLFNILVIGHVCCYMFNKHVKQTNENQYYTSCLFVWVHIAFNVLRLIHLKEWVVWSLIRVHIYKHVCKKKYITWS